MIAPYPRPNATTCAQRSKRVQWIEIGAVLFAAYLPSAFGQLLGPESQDGGALRPAYELCLALTTIALILYVAWRADGNVSGVGFQKPMWLIDIGLGLVLCFLMFYSFRAITAFIPTKVFEHWRSMGQQAPVVDEVRGNLSLLFVFPSLFAVNALEETLMRGYLTSRILAATSTEWLALFIPAILFSLWHCYEGPLGVINAFSIGVLLGYAFLKTRRIWPLIVAHFLYDATITYSYWFHLQHRGHL